MKIKQLKKHIAFGLSLGIILLISSCAGMHSNEGYDNSNNQATLSAENYLQLASSATSAEKQDYLLLATNQFLKDRNLDGAQQTLTQLDNASLDPSLSARKQLQTAHLFVLKHKSAQAIPLLVALENNQNTLPVADTAQLHRLLANAYQDQGQILGSIDERTTLTPFLRSDKDKQDNLLATWESVQSISRPDLNKLLARASNSSQRGWLQLAFISSESDGLSSELFKQLLEWKQRFPGHPAQQLIPNSSSSSTEVAPAPQQIALLLPLSGKLKNQGVAIRNGFFANYYAEKGHNPVTTIRVFDTANKDIITTYQEALQSGAQFVVGPLTKTNIDRLASTGSLPIPTLALNTVTNSDNKIQNLFQFGLSPTDESMQVAIKAWNDNHSRALIIAPSNAWGQRVVGAFKQEWSSLGGLSVDEMTYDSKTNLSKKIRSVLSLYQSNLRAQNVKWLLKGKVRFVPRRRQDVDAIFLVATPSAGQQIKPLLKFYYASDIPVYSTSSIYRGYPSPTRDRDLSGIVFDDIPLVLEKNTGLTKNLSSLRTNIKSLWSTSFLHYPRLYGLGIDSYSLIYQLNKLAAFPQLRISGATGKLYLLPNQHIYRKLSWAQMSNGRPRAIHDK